MSITGEGLTRVQTDPQRNFAVYQAGPIKAGAEIVWTISGGTPLPEPQPTEQEGEAKVKPMPTLVTRNFLIVGPLLLIGFVVVLWYAVTHVSAQAVQGNDSRIRELRMRREQLLNHIASLDIQYENQSLDRREHLRQRDQSKRQLRRIALLLKKS
jgi:hypothetical protein